MRLQSLLPAALFAASAIFSTPAPAAGTAANLQSARSATLVEHLDVTSDQTAARSPLRLAAAKTGQPHGDGGTSSGNTDEAEVILKDSKKDLKVTRKDFAGCMKDWGPQTQMTKDEWAASCRSTLEYFPDAP